ncbi:MAG: hypothetical protein MUF40_06460 [Gemmatimonadaceae bacterium]|nr:hypothetical protein [Gemmatimonadaceae bacterium]
MPPSTSASVGVFFSRYSSRAATNAASAIRALESAIPRSASVMSESRACCSALTVAMELRPLERADGLRHVRGRLRHPVEQVRVVDVDAAQAHGAERPDADHEGGDETEREMQLPSDREIAEPGHGTGGARRGRGRGPAQGATAVRDGRRAPVMAGAQQPSGFP